MNDQPRPRSAGLPITLVLIVAVAAALGLSLAQHFYNPTPAQLETTLLYPNPKTIPAFQLDGPAGSQLNLDNLRGHWTLLFIGFTHCPDVCPTTLGQLAAALKALPGDLQKPQILFVSVDPERDTADAVAEYARFFDPGILAGTADHARLQPFTRSLGMVYMQSPQADGGYTVDHSASVALIDPTLRLRGMIRPPLQPGLIANDLRTLIEAAQ